MSVDDYAVVVGINKYPGISDLRGPENDALAFQNWLLKTDGGDLPNDPEHLQLILSSHFPETDDVDQAHPTIVEVDRALTRLIRIGMDKGGRVGRRLYFFMAGHGFAPDVDESALKMANADSISKYHIPGNEYVKWWRASGLFKEIVLIMDCCRDDDSRAPIHMPPWPPRTAPGTRTKYFYAFATEWSKKSRERRIDSLGEVRGIFSYALITALENAPPNEHGEVTGDRISNYIFNFLPELFETKAYQEPVFRCQPTRDIVFARRKAANTTPVTINFTSPNPTKSILLLDDQFEIAHGPCKMDKSVKVDLAPGIYNIQMLGNGRSKVFQVVGKEEIDVTF